MCVLTVDLVLHLAPDLCVQFRLTNCGVRYPVYLVEEYGEVNHAKLGERALEQAVANTQV